MQLHHLKYFECSIDTIPGECKCDVIDIGDKVAGSAQRQGLSICSGDQAVIYNERKKWSKCSWSSL